MNISHLKYPGRVVLVGLACGLVGDLLMYDQPLGVSLPILILVLVIGLLVLALIEKTALTLSNLWLIVPLLTLSAFSAIRAEPLLRFMNIVGALGLALLLANRTAGAPLLSLHFGGYALAWLESAFGSLIMPFALLSRVAAANRENGHTNRAVAGRILVGIAIALPFLIVFAVLFSSADLVFGKWMDEIVEAIKIPDLIGHAFLTLVLGWLAMGGLAYALTRVIGGSFVKVNLTAPHAAEASGDAESKPAAEPEKSFTLNGILGSIETSVVLFSIDVLFAIFVGIQFAALFGREEFIRNQGITYSEYARRGFFELLAVSIITLGLVLILEFLARRETSRQQVVFLVGSGLMIGMAIVILASAFERMQLYEEAYGFTQLRVYPHIFMVWLAILFAAFLACLITQRVKWFATAVLVFCMGYVITMDVLNPDAFIVQQNIERFRAGNQEFDVEYLGSLSEDAIPYLMPLLTDYGDDVRGRIGPWLKWHLLQLDERQKKTGIGAYHWGINQAYSILDQRREEIEAFDLDDMRYSMARD